MSEGCLPPAGASAIQILRLALGPIATILATSSPKHHKHLKALGATASFDHSLASLVDDIKSASPNGSGVEAIFTVVNGIATNPALLKTLTGPKVFGELSTGRNIAKEQIPEGVNHQMVLAMNMMKEPGAQNLISAMGNLLKEGRYQFPVPVTVVWEWVRCYWRGISEASKGCVWDEACC